MVESSTCGSSSSSAVSFPYPNHVNVSNFVIIALDHNNYLLWEDHILNLIDSHSYQSFISGKVVIPSKTVVVTLPDSTTREIENPDFLLWQRSDKLLKGWITSTLSKDILYYIVGLETSFELWQSLKQLCAQSSLEREFHLHE